MTERRASKKPASEGERPASKPAGAAAEPGSKPPARSRPAGKKSAGKRVKGPKVLARKKPSREHDEPSRSKPPSVAPLLPEVSVLGQALAASELPLFPDFVPDYEWVLGLVEMPGAVVAWAALFLEAGSGLVIHVDLLAMVTPKTVGATLRRAVERGEALGLRRPTRIRIGVPAHAPLLGEAQQAGVALVVGPVPEVEEVLRTPGAVKVVALPTTEDIDVYRGPAPVSDAQLGAFFQAAEELRRGRLARVLQGERPLVLRCPSLGIDGAGAVVEVDERRTGLLITFAAAALSLRFDRIGQLSPARRRELAELRVAPRRGPYPVLSAVGEDGRLRRAEAADYDIATATLLATSRFASEYGALARHNSLRALIARYMVRLGRSHTAEVELGWPEPERGPMRSSSREGR
jgi:hypothetical protein